MNRRSPWARLALLLVPLVLAVGFTAWWLSGERPAAAPASRVPAMPDLKPLMQRLVELGRAFGIDGREVSTVASVRPSFTLDLESPTVAKSPSADLWWHYATRDRRSLDGYNGASLALIADRGYDDVDLAFLSRLSYSMTSLRAWGTSPPLRPGAIIGVRTAEGNFAVVRVLETGSGSADLRLEWNVFYAPPGTASKGVNWERSMQAAMQAYRAKRPDDARRLLAEALAAAESFGPGNARVALVLHRMASFDWSSKRHADSANHLVRAAGIVDRLDQESLVGQVGLQNVLLAVDVHRLLGVVHREQGHVAEASGEFRRAAEIARGLDLASNLDTRAFALASNAYDHAMAECQLGRGAEAAGALRMAREAGPARKATQWLTERMARLEKNLAEGAPCGR